MARLFCYWYGCGLLVSSPYLWFTTVLVIKCPQKLTTFFFHLSNQKITSSSQEHPKSPEPAAPAEEKKETASAEDAQAAPAPEPAKKSLSTLSTASFSVRSEVKKVKIWKNFHLCYQTIVQDMALEKMQNHDVWLVCSTINKVIWWCMFIQSSNNYSLPRFSCRNY